MTDQHRPKNKLHECVGPPAAVTPSSTRADKVLGNRKWLLQYPNTYVTPPYTNSNERAHIHANKSSSCTQRCASLVTASLRRRTGLRIHQGRTCPPHNERNDRVRFLNVSSNLSEITPQVLDRTGKLGPSWEY